MKKVFKRFPLIRQLDKADCALACIRMINKYYNHPNLFDEENYQYYMGKDGISLDAVIEILNQSNFEVVFGKISITELISEALLPCILHWDKKHFVVLYKIAHPDNIKKTKFYIADPDKGRVAYGYSGFMDYWATLVSSDKDIGIAILLEPKEVNSIRIKKSDVSKGYPIIPFLKQYKPLFLLTFIGILIGGGIQLIFPFLTQSIVDTGIKNNNLNFIIYILFGQFFLIVGNMLTDFFRKWLVLKIGSRFSIKLLYDLINKMMRLPVRFFDSKHIGDLLQRFQDHDKIERFITTHAVNFIFSIITLLVLNVVLAIYSLKIFLIYISGSILYIIWTLFFLEKRKRLNHITFAAKSENQSKYHETIKGINDIKLQNSIEERSDELRAIQDSLYSINLKALKLDQYIETGNIFINELKNIIITFFSAYLVLKGDFTLGIMLSIQYIIGQLNVPVNQSITFIHAAQDAKFSMGRINDLFIKSVENRGSIILSDSQDKSIHLKDISFKYILSDNNVINSINIVIPQRKTTAIVGASGSGKTTLVKLLLKFYEITSGTIQVGTVNLKDVDTYWWRDNCGAVLQDGYIFSASIQHNIATNNDIDKDKLHQAVKIANIDTFIDGLPFGFDTQIGDNGINLSQGQKQRLLIARAIYKDPQFIFFDEATNALDANNEKVIVDNLSKFLVDKTAVIVAHRLSTVRNADLILVMDNGNIVEKGIHEELIAKKDYYYKLIKNQLELGL